MNGIPHAALERWRDEFPILQQRTYLNSCSLGALSRRSMGYLGEFQALWNGMGAAAWYEIWLGRLAQLRGEVAGLLDARQTEVALVPSVSSALASIGSAIDFSRRNRVVIADLDFPTLAYQWMARPGVEVVRVPSEDGIGIPSDRWAEYVDDRTALVATSHVFYSTGYVQELEPIAAAAHGAGALFLVDGYQGMGQIPLSPESSGADVYVAGALKWMLGGPGMAYLWVRESRIPELEPSIVSWFGARDQFAFRIDEFEYRDDAERFSSGTPALAAAYAALGGAEIVAEVGIERIRDRIAALTGLLVEGLSAAGFGLRVAAEPARRSGIVMVEWPDSGAAVRELARRGIIVDSRGEYVRVSPHFYNTAEEIGETVEILREMRSESAQRVE